MESVIGTGKKKGVTAEEIAPELREEIAKAIMMSAPVAVGLVTGFYNGGFAKGARLGRLEQDLEDAQEALVNFTIARNREVRALTGASGIVKRENLVQPAALVPSAR